MARNALIESDPEWDVRSPYREAPPPPTVCADCGLRVPRAVADLVDYGTGFRCFACGVRRRIGEHVDAAGVPLWWVALHRGPGEMPAQPRVQTAEETRIETLRALNERLEAALGDANIALSLPLLARRQAARQLDEILGKAIRALASDDDPDPYHETISDVLARGAAVRLDELRRELITLAESVAALDESDDL